MSSKYLGVISQYQKDRETSPNEKSSQSGSIKTEIKSSKSLVGGITETIKFKCLLFDFEKDFSR